MSYWGTCLEALEGVSVDVIYVPRSRAQQGPVMRGGGERVTTAGPGGALP